MPHVLKVMSSRIKSFSPLLLFLNSSQLVHLFLQCTGQNLTHKDYALLYNITLLRTQCKDTVYFSSLYGLQKKKKKEPQQASGKHHPKCLKSPKFKSK